MRGIILAAGQGKRMRPLTDDRPKCLLKIDGTTLLERQVRAFEACGIHDVTLVGGYRAEAIARLGYTVIVNEDYAATDMVHSLFCARQLMNGDSDVVIAYGDITYEPRLLEALCAVDAPISVVIDKAWQQLWDLRFDEPLSDAESLQLGADDRILEIGKEPDGYGDIDGQYVGLVKISSRFCVRFQEEYAALKAAGDTSVQLTQFLQHLIESGWHVQAVPVRRGWFEFDTLGDYWLCKGLIAGSSRPPHYRDDWLDRE